MDDKVKQLLKETENKLKPDTYYYEEEEVRDYDSSDIGEILIYGVASVFVVGIIVGGIIYASGKVEFPVWYWVPVIYVLFIWRDSPLRSFLRSLRNLIELPRTTTTTRRVRKKKRKEIYY